MHPATQRTARFSIAPILVTSRRSTATPADAAMRKGCLQIPRAEPAHLWG
jgi:hypothetical protein